MTVVGRPVYMSPEQSRGRPIGPASDVYAAGVLLYELLAGQPPFDGDNHVEVAMKHLNDPVPPLVERIDPRLAAVVYRALAKEPADRFQSAAEMAVALRAVAKTADTQTTVTRRATTTVTRRVARPRNGLATESNQKRPRRKWPLVVGVTVAAVLAAGTAAIALDRDSDTHDVEPHSSAATPPKPKAAPPQRVTVPKLIGHARRYALRQAEEAGFSINETAYFSKRVPKGRVLGQSPRPGAKAESGADLVIAISKGVRPVRIPALVGRPLATAQQQLSVRGLQSIVSTSDSPGTAAGTVLRQEPKAGRDVPPDTTVSLTVAAEPRWRTVATLNVSGEASTPIFKISGQRWRVRYTLDQGPCDFGPCNPPRLVVTPKSRIEYILPYEMAPGSHETDIPQPPGRYAVSVESGIDPFEVTITVEDYA
jgi:serine/threonine-protein kinase